MYLSSVLFVSIFFAAVLHVSSIPPILISANLRGKRYDVEAEYVEEVSKSVEDQAGLEPGQYAVLFRGKVLSPRDKLETAGVSSGDTLNIIKSKKPRVSEHPADTLDDIEYQEDEPPSPSFGGMPASMDEYKSQLENMNPEQIQAAMKQFDELLDGDFVNQYFADEEKLETLRMQMLNNIDQYEQMMPGFKEQAQEIAADPEKWKQTMNQAYEQIKKMKEMRDARRAMQTQPKAPTDNIEDTVDDSE